MAVPFRLDDELERLGSAAFLRVEAEDGGYRGALFLVTARGEPVEFAYNRIEVRQRFLWRPDQLKRNAARRLAITLFEVCPRAPTLVLCRADEFAAEVFTEDIHLEVPVGRLADGSAVVGQSGGEELELLGDSESVQLFWAGRPPAPDSLGRALFEELGRRGLLEEPFERASAGLSEVYEGHVAADVVG